MSQTDFLLFNQLLPWLNKLWLKLCQARKLDHLAHAYFITGPRGVGKRHLVELFARALICRTPTIHGLACQHCEDCHLLNTRNHPDLLRIGLTHADSKNTSRDISIDAIRFLIESDTLTPSRAQQKIVIIDPADRLTISASNALLKTLEEPVGSTIFCLIGEHLQQLPATIRSRCQILQTPLPQESIALAWLRQHNQQISSNELQLRLRLACGAPLRVLTDITDDWLIQRQKCVTGLYKITTGEQDPVTTAAAWQEVGAQLLLTWLTGWLCDLAYFAVTDRPLRLLNPDQAEHLRCLAIRLSPAALHRFLRRVLISHAEIAMNLNEHLLLESLAIEWAQLTCINNFK